MARDGQVLGMFKFGKGEHVEQFAHGIVYMNTLRHFVEEENSAPRADPHEGTDQVVQGDGAVLQVEIEGQFRRVGEIRGPIRYRHPDSLNVNVFCISALRDSASGISVDPRFWTFGDAFALLVDFPKFLKRVEAAVMGMGQELQNDFVEYLEDDVYEGLVGIFRKASSFSYQDEFRIALIPGTGVPLRLDIGNISDIVVVGRLCDLSERLRVRVNTQGQRELQIKN